MLKSKGSMQKISFYAGLLEKVIIYLMVALVLTIIIRWSQDKLPVLKNLDFWFPNSIYKDPVSNVHANSLHYLREMMLSCRIISFLAEGGLVTVVLLWLFLCKKLMHYFKNGEIFSILTISLLRKISILAVIWAIYAPINTVLMSIFVFHETTEQRGLSIAYASDDATIKLLFSGFLLIIAFMLQEGYYLKSEQDLTV